MTAAARPAARDYYLAAYRETKGRNGRTPEWWRSLQDRGIARFEAVGFPSTKQEDWRFTSVAPIVDAPFTLAEGSWRADKAPAGITVDTLRRAPAALVEPHLGRAADLDANPFTALATAFLHDGIVVHVPANARVGVPLHVRHGISGADVMATPRLLVVVERGASASLVEWHDGAPGSRYMSNAVTEIILGEGARLEYVRVQRDGEAAYHVASVQARLARDAELASTTVTLGAALTRCDLGAVLAGQGAILNLNGLMLLGGAQHADYHTVIDHAQPHCESHEIVNGVFDDRAHGVFNGRIIVRPGAQRTDSKQTNNNVILSGDARADSQPQLEIYADDVKCTHGSTTGPLDPTALFYLRSRGLAPAEARGMLTYGFAADVLGRITAETVRDEIDALVRARLGGQRAAA